MISIYAHASFTLLYLMLVCTKAYEVGRPRNRRTLVTVHLLPPKEDTKTPHFQEELFRDLKETSSYSYSYNSKGNTLKPCNQTTAVEENVTLALTPMNQTADSFNMEEATPLNGTADGSIHEESFAKSSAATQEVVTKAATIPVVASAGVALSLIALAAVVFVQRRRWKTNANNSADEETAV